MRWIELPDFLRHGTHAQKEQGVVKLDAFHMELFIKNGKRKFWWSRLQIFIENQTIGKIEYKRLPNQSLDGSASTSTAFYLVIIGLDGWRILK